MRRSATIALAALPGAAAAYAVREYRHAVAELDGLHAAPPDLPGSLRSVGTRWGRVAYRRIDGSPDLPPLVLVHGWGRTGDTSWWPLYQRLGNTIISIDLPGHGRSFLESRRFSLGLAAEAISTAIGHAGIERPLLVGHSMGGPAALTALRLSYAEDWAGFVAVATSATWVRPRHRVMVASAPYLLFPRSPIMVRAQREDLRRSPEEAARIAWEYAVRPSRQVLMDAALELTKFDARRWHDFELPPTTWVVSTADGIIDPRDQRASAAILGARVIELAVDHSVQVNAPDTLARVIHAVSTKPMGPLLVAV